MRFTGGFLALLLVLATSLSASANDPSFAIDVEEWHTDWLGYSGQILRAGEAREADDHAVGQCAGPVGPV